MSESPNGAIGEATADATDEGQWFSRQEFMRVFRKSDSTVDRWIKEGKVEYRKEGRRVFIRPLDEATPEDPLEAIMKAILRLSEQQAELTEEVHRLRLEIAPGAPQRVLGHSTSDAPPEDAPVASRRGWWKRFLYGETEPM